MCKRVAKSGILSRQGSRKPLQERGKSITIRGNFSPYKKKGEKKMIKPKIVTIPDIPEIDEALKECTCKIAQAMESILLETDSQIFLNSFINIFSAWSTAKCENQNELDETLEVICDMLILISNTWFKIRKGETINE